jgi:hypothetical protein
MALSRIAKIFGIKTDTGAGSTLPDGTMAGNSFDDTLYIGMNSQSNLLFEDVSAGKSVDSGKLNGQAASYYTNASNISSGTLAKERLDSNAAGDGLGFSSGVLAVNVDASSIEIDTDTLRVKASGITNDMLAGSIADGKLTEDYIKVSEIDDTATDNHDDNPISSHWAHTHVNAADPHTGYMLESNIGTGANNYLQLNGSSQIPAVDGSLLTSVDADTVDTLHASSFLRSDADDTATGIITLSSNSGLPLQITGSDNGKILLKGSNRPYIQFQEGADDKASLQWHDDGYLRFANQEDDSILRIKDDLDFSDDNGSTWYSIYHENNFGKTEIDNLNIDADTVDTLHASSFLRSDTNDEATGVITLSSDSQFPLHITGADNGKILLSGATTPYIRFQETDTDKAFIQWDPDGCLLLKNQEDLSQIRIKDDLDFTPDNGAHYYSIYHEDNLTKSVLEGLTIDSQYSNVIDSAGHTTNNNVEDCLAEIYQRLETLEGA